MEKVLIIEDDKDISELISIHISDMDFEVDTAFDGKVGLLKALNNTYKFILLDIRLPFVDGFEICKKVRQEKITTPILMLTSKSEEIDKVLGLEIGADDYITKPFSVRELIARVKAVLRRVDISKQPQEETEKKIKNGELFIDVGMRIVEIEKKRIELSPKGIRPAGAVGFNPGKTFTRMSLLNQVWGYEFEGFEHTVNSHINRLRTKIESNLNQPEYILTTWGVGYKFREN